MADNIQPQLPLAVTDSDGAYKSIKTAEESVRQNLKMIVLTAPGERIQSPNFGVGVRNFLFENFTPASTAALRGRIISQVNTYAPYIQITGVNTGLSENNPNTMLLEISYNVSSFQTYSDTLALEIGPDSIRSVETSTTTSTTFY
jgi:phage baseplate assembly protein W